MQSVDLRHRLLVILAADAAGYSRLMALDDVGSLSALDSARRVFGTHIKAHGGRFTVKSSQDRGTTFFLHFPLSEENSNDRVS